MHKLQQLRALARNKAAARPLAVDVAGDTATVWLYDFIGRDEWTGTGISAEQFAQELRGITAPNILLRINSPGGSVFDGRAMYSAIQMHPAKVVALVEGVAASAATSVAMAADEVRMVRGSLFMIHRAWTLALGNSEDLRSTAALLDKVDQGLVDDYVRKTKKSAATVLNWMAAETWFTADEAKAEGFADEIVDGVEASAALWDLSPYRATGAQISSPTQDAPAAEDPSTKRWEEAARRLRLFESTLA